VALVEWPRHCTITVLITGAVGLLSLGSPREVTIVGVYEFRGFEVFGVRCLRNASRTTEQGV
jgi:hypothetical protein